jgi:hypothetical protein
MRIPAVALALLFAACGPKTEIEEPPPPPPPEPDTTVEKEVEPPPPPEPDASTSEEPPVVKQDWGPETIILAQGSKQGQVTFGHLPHENRIGCVTCHHEMEDPQGEAQACHDCHNAQTTDTHKAKKAFHLQCHGCHKTEGKGPLSCTECHQK